MKLEKGEWMGDVSGCGRGKGREGQQRNEEVKGRRNTVKIKGIAW